MKLILNKINSSDLKKIKNLNYTFMSRLLIHQPLMLMRLKD